MTLVGDRWAAATDGPSLGEVLFLHGGGQTRHAWRQAAGHLAGQGWSATTLDLRGHGDSSWASSRRGYRLTEYADDIALVVDDLGGDVVLVGASLGGLSAMTLASRPEASVRALVMIDVGPRLESDGTRRIHDFMTAHPDGFPDLHAVADAVASYTRKDRPRNLTGLKKNVRQREDGRWYWHWDPAMFDGGDRQREDFSHAALLDVARRVTVPTLLVRGQDSDVLRQEGLREMQEVIADATTTEVAGAAHMVAGDDNDRFVAAMEPFLDRLASQPHRR